ncbi:MAG: dihydrolipoamide acetyltransferase family protein [Colwellia sp.]|nr:dihydrolipoamide acetyltransferase family protein [Colwellia sp.]
MTKSIDITMPSLGADMTEGMLVEWLIKEGDKVQHGDVIAVLETQKGAIDMEVYHDGIITQLLVQPVNTVPVGTVLATIEVIAAEEDATEELVNESKQERPVTDKIVTEQITPEQTTNQQSHIQNVKISTNADKVFASPVVRKIAKAQQLDLSAIKGSGPNGAVILKDIVQITQKAVLSDGDLLTNMRSAISAAMTKSKQEIPHFYLSLDVTINKAQQWLQQVNHDKTPQEHILLIALLLKAVALTLIKYPSLNGFYRDYCFEQASEINIANVISLRTGGVVVPALRNVEQLSVPEIMYALRDMTRRSRAIERGERLRSSELMNATITITNMGERGADRVFGIIYPPQVAIIGFGKVNQVPQVCGDNIDIGEQLTVCLSADHRVVDGMLAAKFLNSLAKKLQKPEQL